MTRRLEGVRLFKAGQWKGDDYTPKKLDEAVENFRRFQKPGTNRLQKAPIVIGHGAEDLDDDSIPKYGEVLSLSRSGPWLIGDIDADDELADAIEKGRYDDLSAELYPSPPEGVPGNGLMLRRVAILGGDIPHVKGLNPGGLKGKIARHGECRFRVTRFSQRRGKVAVFSEERSMSRDEMLTALAARGLDHDIIEGMDDLQLAECMKMATEEAPNPTDVPTAATDSPTTFDESMMPEDKEKASEFCRKMAELYKKKFGEDLMTVPAKPLPEEKPVEKAEEKKEDPLADRQFSEMARAQAKLFCETYRDRIDPAELDETAGPTLLDRLMAADDSRKIFKFSENGKQVALTQREEMMRSVRLRKIRYGGDKVKGGSAGVVTFAEGATKKDKIKAFAESKSDKLALMGMTAAEYANAWEIAQGSDKAELENGIGFTG